MLIYEALKRDHIILKRLLDELVNLRENADLQRKELISEIRNELISHARAEEAVLYNSIRDVATASPVISEAYQEHIEAETILHYLQLKDIIDWDWKTSAMELRDAISHHIDEEENYIFSVAQQLFTTEEAQVMAEAFVKLKPQIKEEGLVQTSVDFVINMMPARIASTLRTLNMNPKI